MTMELSHQEAAELLGAYALDAVDADEAEAVEQHLRDCPRCRAEVAQHREVAALLGNAGGPAPAGLWERITAELEEAPPGLDLAPVVALSATRRRWGWTAGAAAAAAAVLIAGLGIEVGRLDRRVNQLQRPLNTAGIQQAALAAEGNPDARRVELRSDLSSETANVVVLPDGQAYIVTATLPSLPPNQTYQLWGIVGGTTKVSLGLLGPHPTTTAFRMDPARMPLLAITAEPAGGVSTTDHTPVVSGTIS